jgi:hypothetical protein
MSVPVPTLDHVLLLPRGQYSALISGVSALAISPQPTSRILTFMVPSTHGVHSLSRRRLIDLFEALLSSHHQKSRAFKLESSPTGNLASIQCGDVGVRLLTRRIPPTVLWGPILFSVRTPESAGFTDIHDQPLFLSRPGLDQNPSVLGKLEMPNYLPKDILFSIVMANFLKWMAFWSGPA